MTGGCLVAEAMIDRDGRKKVLKSEVWGKSLPRSNTCCGLGLSVPTCSCLSTFHTREKPERPPLSPCSLPAPEAQPISGPTRELVSGSHCKQSPANACIHVPRSEGSESTSLERARPRWQVVARGPQRKPPHPDVPVSPAWDRGGR